MKFDALIFNAWREGPSADFVIERMKAHFTESRLKRAHPQGKPTARELPKPRNLRECGPEAIANQIEGCLSQHLCYALPWHISTTLVLARAGECSPFLAKLKHEFRSQLISEYENVDVEPSPFRLACFGDYDGEGDVCWDVARGDDEGVLVLCEFCGEGDWWRPTTALAEPLYADAEKGYARVVYRATSAKVLRGLWSRTSYGDGIATLCAPESAGAERVARAADGDSDSAMLAFAKQHGWIYQQRYGGGADEHYARFAAKNPELAAAAYRYAAARAASEPGWWLSGMF